MLQKKTGNVYNTRLYPAHTESETRVTRPRERAVECFSLTQARVFSAKIILYLCVEDLNFVCIKIY